MMADTYMMLTNSFHIYGENLLGEHFHMTSSNLNDSGTYETFMLWKCIYWIFVRTNNGCLSKNYHEDFSLVRVFSVLSQ